MKKWLIIILCAAAFYKGVLMLDEKANVEMFDEFYERNYPLNDDDSPSLIDKIKEFFSNLFSDKEEKFIYK